MAVEKKRNKSPGFVLSCVFSAVLCALLFSSADAEPQEEEPFFHVLRFLDLFRRSSASMIVEDEETDLVVKAADEGKTVFYSSQGYYRYGPSILENEDGSYDAWFSAPGNNSTQWDWITYRHSDDGIEWSREKTVLKPTEGSKDQCSVCDPGVVCFGGYYYLGYTSTADYGRRGYNNSAFVARSKDPDGPFEKWNGKGWGGKPQPIIKYEGDPRGWGIGELSFVLMGNELYIYYTYFDTTGGYTSLAKAEVCEDWPATIEEKGAVLGRTTQDSLDVFYADDLKMFLAFSIENRMSEGSGIALYASGNGQQFEYCDVTNQNIENYAHNMGIAKDREGHQKTDRELLAGYAYGRYWGRWNLKFQKVTVTDMVTYKIIETDGS